MSIPTATYDKIYDYATYRNNKQNNNTTSENNVYDYNTYRNNKGTYSYETYHNNKLGIGTEQIEPKKTKRGLMDRLFGMLGYSGIVEGIYNIVDDDPDSTFISGLGEGLKYYSPFTNDVSGRHTFSDVLEQMGWENDEGVTASDVGRGVVGFLGDVLLDPLSYVGGAGAAAKVVKGSGKVVSTAKPLSKLSKTLYNIGKADDITKEVKAVTGAVNASNIKRFGGVTKQTAKEVLLKTDGVVGKSVKEIDDMAEALAKETNKKVFRFAEGGEDLTIGFKNFPFANKIKIGDRTLDSFSKTLVTSEQLRTLGDKTIAPYYNRLAKSLRTSRLGQAFSKYSKLETLADAGDIEAVLKRMHFENMQKIYARLPLDQLDIKNGQRIANYWESLGEDERRAFEIAYHNGEFKSHREVKSYMANRANKTGEEIDANYVKQLLARDADIEDFFTNSKYDKIRNRVTKLQSQDYVTIPPVRGEFVDDMSFYKAVDEWLEMNPHKTIEDVLDYYAETDIAAFNNLNDQGLENMKRFSRTIKELDDKYIGNSAKVEDIMPRQIAIQQKLNPNYNTVNDSYYAKDTDTYGLGYELANQKKSRFKNNVKFANDNNNIITEHISGSNADKISPESVSAHEFGHRLYHSFSKETQGKISELVNEFSTDELSSMLSKRAMSDVNELTAEATSAVLHGVNNEFTKKFSKLILSEKGINLEKFNGLKWIEDDKTFNEYLKHFNNFVATTQKENINWWNTKDEIRNILGLSNEDKEFVDLVSDKFETFLRMEKEFGDEDFAIYKLLSDRMDEIADAEILRDFLTKEQWEKMSGKYLYHLVVDNKAVKELLEENASSTGFMPELYGALYGYGGHRKSFSSIYEINDYHRMKTAMDNLRLNGHSDIAAKLVDMDAKDFSLVKDVEKALSPEELKIYNEFANEVGNLLETDLAQIYLTRTLGSNKLIQGADVQNYMKKNFLHEYKVGNEVAEGSFAVTTYGDFHNTLKKYFKDDLIRKHQRYDKDIINDKIKGVIDELAKLSGDDTWAERFTWNVPLQKLNDEQISLLRKYNIPIYQAADDIIDSTNVLTRAQKATLQSNFGVLYDKLMQIWKVNNTIVHPGFHLQNAVSNAYQSFLAIGEDALNMKKIRKAWNVFKNPDPKQTIKIGDKIWTYKELNYAAQKSGVIDEMFHTYELDSSKHGGILGNKIPAGLDPTNMEEFWLYKWGTKLGTNIEGTQRMNLFISALGKTYNNIEEAVEMVNKFLFDYSDLTDFEQNAMKRIIPFYTFMRKNLPMELEQMFNRPQLFATMQKGVTNFEKLGEDYVDENHRNEWRQEHIQIPNTGYGIADQLPYNQFDKVLSLNKLLGQTTPLIKVPYELYNGKYAYTDMDIDDTGGYLANQGFWTKMINVADKYEDPEEKRNYVLGQLLGFPIGRMYRE